MDPEIFRVVDNVTLVDIQLLNIINHQYVYFHYSIITILGLWLIVANGAVILTFLKYPQLRTCTNAFVINIAITDLLTGLNQFSSVQVYLRRWYTIEEERICCLIVCATYVATNILSIQGLFMVDGER